MTDAVLSIDQGTSATKAILVDAQRALVGRGSAPLASSYPRPGWVEQNAEQLWVSVLTATGRCLAAAPGVRPIALALTNQRESALVWWRADGTPAGPVIGWQDNRTEERCEQLRANGCEGLVRTRTGLPLDPMFSATKLRWLLEHADGGLAAAERGELCAGTVDAWLVWKLTGGAVFACDAGNAARTQLMDLRDIAWDPDLLELFGIPADVLPDIRRSDGGFGRTVAAGEVPSSLPVAAVLADSHAALYAHGAVAPGAAKATFGTGSSVMAPVTSLDSAGAGVSQTLAWLTDEPTWALEGNVIATGAAIDWMARTLGIPGGAGVESLAAGADSTDGVHFVPAFAGLGAPHWDRGAVGLVLGLTQGTTRPQLALAALESVAHQVTDVLEAMEDASDVQLGVLHADGGGSASERLMQLQADLSGRPVVASAVAEMSALGAAYLAGVACGAWLSRAELGGPPHARRTYEPSISELERERQRSGWRAAVARSLDAAVEAELR